MNTALRSTGTIKTLQGMLFGVLFGFLLQKGGVGKYHVLEGQLLLQDFTVATIMLSAILIGMVGIFFLQQMTHIKMHIVPTNIGANILGGLIFGVGFALAGYCPGTGAVALGQGDLPAVIFIFGLVIGSYVYAEASQFLGRTVATWGSMGQITLPSVLGVKTGVFVAIFAVLLCGVLFMLNRADVR